MENLISVMYHGIKLYFPKVKAPNKGKKIFHISLKVHFIHTLFFVFMGRKEILASSLVKAYDWIIL